MTLHPLGRQRPKDWAHVDRYPLRGFTGQVAQMPVVLGVDWHTNFDRPQQGSDGRWWIGRGDLGTIRGGHAICVKSRQPDADSWWSYYNQGTEGACVGFATSRLMSHLNRVRYDARWLYKEAQKVDYWPGEDYQGTAVSAAFDVLRDRGHRMQTWVEPRVSAGISANRWLTTVDEVHQVIDLPLAVKLGAVPLMNSWGLAFPRVTWMPDETLALLLEREGEAGVVTDR